jgi:hypothetical protein
MNEKELDNLCDKLKDILKHELAAGNRIIAVETGWSKVNLAIRLAEPLDHSFLHKTAENNPDLQIWYSRDVKNPQETGVLCKSSQQTLSGPLEKRKSGI